MLNIPLKTEKIMKIGAAYIRVSTDEQTEASPDSQIAEILKYAEKNGIDVPKKYIYVEGDRERGLSGRRAANRPKFQEMIATAKVSPRPFECILLWKFSRFARNVDEATYYKSILRNKCGIDVISVSEPIAEGMYGRLIEMIIEWSDEFYSFNLAGEVMRGMTARARAGKFSSYAPIGYKTVDKNLVPDEMTAWAVREIFEAYARGERVRDIAARINGCGVRTRHGNEVDARLINYVIDNPVYKGEIVFSGGKRCEDDVIRAQGVHEPLVSCELWETCQKRRGDERQMARRGSRKNEYALHSLLRCGACGAVLSYASGGRLQCSAYNRGVCRVSHSISCEAAEQAVIKQISNDVPDLSFTVAKSQTEGHDRDDVIARLERRKSRLSDAYLLGIYTADEFRCERDKIAEALEREQKRKNAPMICKEAMTLMDAYRNLTEEERNRVLCAIIDMVVVHKSGGGYALEIKYKSFHDFHDFHD